VLTSSTSRSRTDLSEKASIRRCSSSESRRARRTEGWFPEPPPTPPTPPAAPPGTGSSWLLLGTGADMLATSMWREGEVQALRDKCKELADDVRALATLVNALRGALVSVGVVKGGA
jgi:predicted heme/steroid binding protein